MNAITQALKASPHAPALQDCMARIESWLSDASISDSDKREIENLVRAQEIAELRDRFYRELEFGTGGLRGVVGAGTNRVNAPVIRRATQGLANFIKKAGPDAMRRGVAIAHDSRLSSPALAREAARVLAGNGINVHMYPTLQTTPCLSWAVRALNCVSGICLTASHNPPQYNGFKVYWEDGAQIIPPQDAGILAEVFAIRNFSEAQLVDFDEGVRTERIRYVPDDVLDAYFAAVKTLQLHPDADRSLKIVYTPLHGTGAAPVRRALKEWGYPQLTIVPEQEMPDGHFPTVKKPNPEEPSALKMAVERAARDHADVALATDPDSDRLALVVRDPKAARGLFRHQAIGEYVLLNGNQTGALMIDAILAGHARAGTLRPDHAVVKTIVTSELHQALCDAAGVKVFNTLTGFKWIAGLVRSWERAGAGSPKYLFGTEESFGYMPGDYVRDKDGIAALCQAVEMVSVLKSRGLTACDRLLEIFETHGAWQEDLINVDLEGEEGAARIARMMTRMRTLPKPTFGGLAVKRVFDCKEGVVLAPDSTGTMTRTRETIDFPPSDVLQFELVDGSRVSMRPSGTEPKLKFYVSVCTRSKPVADAYARTLTRLSALRSEIEAFVSAVP